MKKFLLIISMIVPMISILGQSPGGVGTPVVWLKADQGTTLTGSTVSGWTNSGSSGGTAGQLTSNGTTAYTLPTFGANVHNFNPAITDNVAANNNESLLLQNVFPSYAHRNLYSFVLQSHPNVTAQSTMISYTDLPRTTGSRDEPWFANSTDSQLYYFWQSSYQTQPTYPNSIKRVNNIPSVNAYYANQWTANPQTGSISMNGAETTFSGNSAAGNGFGNHLMIFGDGGANNPSGGSISEIITYDRVLTTTEKQQVNSYLAVKYGITLTNAAGTAPANYLNSAAGTVWSTSTNTGYNNNIAGIANDAGSSLNQKQSKSVNTGQKLIIGNGSTLADTNALNGNPLTSGQYLLWGDNGLNQGLSVALANPAAPGGETNYRFASVWRVQNTGNVGTVTVAWPATGLENFHLIKSSNSTIDAGDTFIPMTGTTTVNGVTYNTATVTFTDGDYFTFGSYVHAPGGVLSTLWYRADKGLTPATGPVTNWTDYSFNQAPVSPILTTTSAPTSVDGIGLNFNFNPAVTFAAANALGNTGVLNPTSSGNYTVYTSTTAATGDRIVGLTYSNLTGGAAFDSPGIGADVLGLRNAAGTIIASAGVATGYKYTQLTNTTIVRNNFTNTLFTRALNGAVAGANITYSNTATGPNGGIMFGRNANYSGGDDAGSGVTMSETIVFDGVLSATDINKIDSYLAIKGGITLNTANTPNYLDSNGAIVWSGSVNTGYTNNIFGIAHDFVSDLHQKQSRSINDGQKLIIGNGSSLFNTNALNTNNMTDGQFLMVGDNGLRQRFSVPLAYTSGANGEVNFRFESVWKVQKTSGVGAVTLAWPKGISNLYLVQSTDASFTAGNTFTPMNTEVTVNGVVYNTATVTLGDGEFFTFAGFANAPGGVINNLSYWYRADINAANTGAGTDVTTWTDFFSGAVLTQMGTNALPKFNPGATDYFNFNPGINFTAGTQTLGNVNVRTFSADSYDIFTFTKEGMTGTLAYPSLFRSLVDNAFLTGGLRRWDGLGIQVDNGMERFSNTGGNTDTGVFTPAGAFSTTIPSIMYNTFTANSTTRALNGSANFATTTHGGTGVRNLNGGHLFGDSQFGGNGSDNRGFTGNVGETIIYGEGNLTAQERRRVDSYMAIKYGLTLERVATDNYLASDAGIVWNGAANAAYNNNIFGIANDQLSALHQKQSKSVNANQKMIIGAGTSLANTNAANTNSLTAGQYLIVGDNGLRQGLSVALAYTAGTNGEVNFRFESVWKVQKTTSIGTVTVAWPKSVQNLYLVQSLDENFTGGDTFTPMTTEVTVNGVVYNTAAVTLGNGEFFTFAGYGHAPGGVINSLSYWYRADKDAVNAGAGTDVTTWTDYFSGNVLSQMGTNTLPKYVNGTANYFNYNPGLNFTSSTSQSIGNVSSRTVNGLDYDIFTFTKEGIAGPGNGRLFSSLADITKQSGSISYWDGIGLNLNSERIERVNYQVTQRYLNNPGGVVYSTTIPSIMYNQFRQRVAAKGLNGALENSTNGTAGFDIGLIDGGHVFGDPLFSGNGSDNRGFTGHLGETIIYGAGSLSAVERRRVDSYMAIKYGITLARVGTDHYLGSTASATSIVWSGTLNATYNNNIFGIARADIGGFEQKVSKSVNAGTILTIAKDNDFVSSNLAASRTGLPVNESYLILGDNNNTSTVLYTPTEIGNCGEIIGATEQIKLIPRKWLVQRTSSIGGTYLQANLAAYTADLNTEIKMYVADDENFTQNVVAVAGTQSGNNWVFPYNFDNGNAARYITFGGKFAAAPCEQCKGGTYTLRTGYQWNQGAWTNQTVNNKQNILLGNDADGNPLYASMYADYSANPSIEYVPTRYPQQYAGRWTIGRRYDNTNAQVQHRIELTKAMKASFQISNINTYRNNKNNFQVIGYCNGAPVMPKITYAYNTSYHTFNIAGNQAIGTMSWRGFVPNVSTANVRFDRPVERIVIICSVDRVNTDRTLRSVLYSDITLECAAAVPPTPDNVYVSHSYTQETLTTCGGNTTMRIKVTNNNICNSKTIDLHQTLPAGLTYVPGSFNGNDLPAGAMTGATLTYTGGNFELSGLSLPSGEHWMYVDVANPGVVGTYPTQFTYEVTNGVNPTNTLSSPVVNLNYYQSTAPVQASPALTLSIKNNVTCGTNNMVMTYRMKIDNPNTTSITGAEILHMFDHNQVIQSVTYVTGEDEDGVITGNYPVDGAGATIDPINNNIFNLIDAELPVGVSYIDITVNTGNSYSTPDVQAQGISSTFLVGIGNGECAESGESTSNEVVLPMCAATCYKPGAIASAGNPALNSKMGITSLNRAGGADNWPAVRTGAWLVLEAKTKGFVPNRMAFSGGNPVGIAPANFVEGMIVYDTTNKCLKMYTSTDGSNFAWSCINTQTCPD